MQSHWSKSWRGIQIQIIQWWVLRKFRGVLLAKGTATVARLLISWIAMLRAHCVGSSTTSQSLIYLRLEIQHEVQWKPWEDRFPHQGYPLIRPGVHLSDALGTALGAFGPSFVRSPKSPLPTLNPAWLRQIYSCLNKLQSVQQFTKFRSVTVHVYRAYAAYAHTPWLIKNCDFRCFYWIFVVRITHMI